MNKNKREQNGAKAKARVMAFILAAIMIFTVAATLIAVLVESGHVH